MADMTDDDLLRIATTLGLPFGMLDHDYCKSMEIEPGTRSYGEVTCDGMVRFARAVLAAQPAPAPEELSPEFTDTARAALLWVLWHHQGASSAVGQPIRFALGMGAHDRLNGRQIAEAKQWATTTGSTTAEFHKVPAAPAVPDLIPPDALFVCGQMGVNVTRVRVESAAPAVPDGWVMVPVEPTQEMIDAADAIDPDQFWSEPLIQEDGTKHRTRDCDSVLYYRAMISAAPAVRKRLTDEQIDAISLRDGGVTYRQLARAIERAHGITGDSK